MILQTFYHADRRPPTQGTLMLAEHVKIGLFEPGPGRGRLFPNADASFGDDRNEQGSGPFMNGLAILQTVRSAFGPPGLSFNLEYSTCKAEPA